MKTWAAEICAFAVAAGMLRMLVPKGSVVRIYRLVLCSVMLCVVLGPLLKLFPQLSHALTQSSSPHAPSSSFSEAVQEQSLEAMQESLTSLAAQTLEKASIPYMDISVLLTVTEDNEVALAKLEVTLPTSSSATQAKEVLKEKLGLEAEVKTDGG